MSGQKVNLLQGRVRIEDWPLSEKRDVFGGCLRGAFPPHHNGEIESLLKRLEELGRNDRRDRRG